MAAIFLPGLGFRVLLQKQLKLLSYRSVSSSGKSGKYCNIHPKPYTLCTLYTPYIPSRRTLNLGNLQSLVLTPSGHSCGSRFHCSSWSESNPVGVQGLSLDYSPYNPLCNPSFHFIFHFLFQLILHYWGIISLSSWVYGVSQNLWVSGVLVTRMIRA